MACELPHHFGLPLARFSVAEIRQEVLRQGLVAEISGVTLWRWLSQDAIRPWRYRSWIFPRDPLFLQKASPILDLYQGLWNGTPLTPADFVICADEKTSIQARQRQHPILPPGPRRPSYVEHEYQRRGALIYIAAWDVHHAKLFGCCEAQNGIAPFDRLVTQVMSQEPYRSAQRVFWIMDNGSAHRGPQSVRRLQNQWPSLIPLHTPVHASWLNQIEIYFSILQRKVLTPNDFASRAELGLRLLAFQQHYQKIATPFRWTFTRQNLAEFMTKLKKETPTAA